MVVWNTVAEPLLFYSRARKTSVKDTRLEKITQKRGKDGFEASSKRLGSQAEVFVPTLCKQSGCDQS